MNNGNNTGIVQPRACMYTQQRPDILLEMCERESRHVELQQSAGRHTQQSLIRDLLQLSTRDNNWTNKNNRQEPKGWMEPQGGSSATLTAIQHHGRRRGRKCCSTALRRSQQSEQVSCELSAGVFLSQCPRILHSPVRHKMTSTTSRKLSDWSWSGSECLNAFRLFRLFITDRTEHSAS